MRYVALAALVSGMFAAPALAQDAPAMSGFHIEGLGGWDRGNFDREHTNGVVYGLGVGYDVQAGRALFGIEGEASDSTGNRCIGGAVIAGDRACADFGRDLYVGGRAGALIGGNTLLYVKAGYTNARAHLSYDDGTPATVADFDLHRNLDGVRAGAGLQFGLGANAYVRTEYRYSNYQDGVERHQVVGAFGFNF